MINEENPTLTNRTTEQKEESCSDCSDDDSSEDVELLQILERKSFLRILDHGFANTGIGLKRSNIIFWFSRMRLDMNATETVSSFVQCRDHASALEVVCWVFTPPGQKGHVRGTDPRIKSITYTCRLQIYMKTPWNFTLANVNYVLMSRGNFFTVGGVSACTGVGVGPKIKINNT